VALQRCELVAVTFDLDGKGGDLGPARGDDFDRVAHGASYDGIEQVEDDLSEDQVRGSDAFRSALAELRHEQDVTFSEIAFCHTLHLLEDVFDVEIGSWLGEATLRDVVNLLVVQNSVQNPLRLIQSLLAYLPALPIQMIIEFFEIDE